MKIIIIMSMCMPFFFRASDVQQELKVQHQKKQNFTELMRACIAPNNQEKIVTLLAQKANVCEKDKNGKTALHWATQCGSPEAIQLLIDNKADINALANGGRTPLFCAVDSSHPQETIELLLKLKSDTYIRDKNGMTILDFIPLSGVYDKQSLLKLFPLHKEIAEKTKDAS